VFREVDILFDVFTLSQELEERKKFVKGFAYIESTSKVLARSIHDGVFITFGYILVRPHQLSGNVIKASVCSFNNSI